jgi:hypothetical protein
MTNAELRAAYTSTSYCVEISGQEINLRVGEKNREFDAILRSRNVSKWAFITAFNPRSTRLSVKENEERDEHLATMLSELRYSALICRTVDDDGEWPVERGYVVLGIDRHDAEILARRFEQNAILVGRVGNAPELVMLVEETSAEGGAAD